MECPHRAVLQPKACLGLLERSAVIIGWEISACDEQESFPPYRLSSSLSKHYLSVDGRADRGSKGGRTLQMAAANVGLAPVS